jgi:hypothetical protein
LQIADCKLQIRLGSFQCIQLVQTTDFFPLYVLFRPAG